MNNLKYLVIADSAIVVFSIIWMAVRQEWISLLLILPVTIMLMFFDVYNILLLLRHRFKREKLREFKHMFGDVCYSIICYQTNIPLTNKKLFAAQLICDEYELHADLYFGSNDWFRDCLILMSENDIADWCKRCCVGLVV